MTLKRVSPLLERNSETINLNLAPHPWKILKCAETGIVFLENPLNNAGPPWPAGL